MISPENQSSRGALRRQFFGISRFSGVSGNHVAPYGVHQQERGSQRSEAPIEDTDLIARAKAGDQYAFEQLVGRYQDVAFRVACLITRDRDEAQDATQTGFIKALQALGSFRDDAPFRPWLLRIVANEAKNRARTNARRSTGPLDERIVSLAPSPEELTERLERQHELLAAIRNLSEQDQQVITYRYFLDLSEPEMADLLECPRGTVKSRLSRAKDRLRMELMREPGGTANV